jgi:hypothetical protein
MPISQETKGRILRLFRQDAPFSGLSRRRLATIAEDRLQCNFAPIEDRWWKNAAAHPCLRL